MSDVCSVLPNDTNLESNLDSCNLKNVKHKKVNLSSNSSQVQQNILNSRASPQKESIIAKTWNLYSEYTMSGQAVSHKESVLWSHSTVKT